MQISRPTLWLFDQAALFAKDDEGLSSVYGLRRGVLPALQRLTGLGVRLVTHGPAMQPLQVFLQDQGIAVEHGESLEAVLTSGALQVTKTLIVARTAPAWVHELKFNLALAENWLSSEHLSLLRDSRRAKLQRQTKETTITLSLDLDPEPQLGAAAGLVGGSGLAFFDHMLDQLASHGGFHALLAAQGDLQVDAHHTVEDIALVLGQAMRQALGDKRGIGRYGFTLPMDEALAEAALDLSGRPLWVFDGNIPGDRIGDMAVTMLPHFFRSFCDSLGASLHVKVRGDDPHHMAEAVFKAVGRALRPALARNAGQGLPSTKGIL